MPALRGEQPPAPVQSRGHKRKRSIKHALEVDPEPKRQQTSPSSTAEDAFDEPAVRRSTHKHTDPVAFWVEEARWPAEQDWPEVTPETDSTMDRLPFARKKPSSNPSRKRSNSAISTTPNSAISTTPSVQKPRDEKSAPYRDPRYKYMLKERGSFMTEALSDLASPSKALCRSLLEKMPPVPSDTLFHDNVFATTCRKIRNKNEARVVQDITHLDILTESVNEGWNNSISLDNPRPQPNYSVGFKRDAFTKDQLDKLSPFVGTYLRGDQSLFIATLAYYMYFPFLTCEVKSGAAAFDLADRQNAHSMTFAVRGIVELFRYVKLRIYGHYPVVGEKDPKYYRHPIRQFCFTELNGREKWTAYRFTKANICSTINQVPPDVNFDVSSLSRLSQDWGDPIQSAAYSASAGEQDS
ncbi:hypothetical protein QBC39DRAFT_393688 [Podospora conica]|nr:hypothetical protein QBC39DRAFT_393688 [Schizothecium conicum]